MNRRSVGLVAVVLATASCSSATGKSPTTTNAPITASFACITATAMAGLTSAATIGEARQRLLLLTTDTTISDEQRSYFAEQVAALEGKPDDNLAEPILLRVPCNLRDP